jgi:hypothetical protein
MLEVIGKFQTNNMQLMRIEEYPFQTEENFIVMDNLENGELSIYEHIKGPLNIQQLLTGFRTPDNVALVAKITINELWKENAIFIHKISCEHGFEYLAEPMLYQVLDYIEFYYEYQAVGISDREYHSWLPYAGKALDNFKRENRVYVFYKN